jgi:gamma-glutamyltranspeptidase / glutathione hydrolase
MGAYRGYEIYKPGFWTQGPVMIEALNILEGFDLKAMGHNSPQYSHTVVEAVKLAFADRDAYYGDPKFSKIAGEILLSRDYAAERRKLIDPAHASIEHRPGPAGLLVPLTSTSASASGPVNDTTCVNVIDRQGNAFSATPSGAWLPSVIAGDTGIPFTTRLQSFVMTSGHPNQLQPGKRPRVTLSPTLVTRGGKLEMILSTPGGDNQDQALLQVLLNIIEFDMSPQEAVEAPRFQTEHFYSSFANHEFTPGRLNLESRIRWRPATPCALSATASRSQAIGAIRRRQPSSGCMQACSTAAPIRAAPGSCSDAKYYGTVATIGIVTMLLVNTFCAIHSCVNRLVGSELLSCNCT